jgi:hypothetical protein
MTNELSFLGASVRSVVKIDVDAVARMLPRRGYIYGMPTFTLAGATYDYLAPTLEGNPAEVHSWEYGSWPKVEAAVPLTGSGTVQVYGEAARWGHDHVIVSWRDDAGQTHWAWIPAANVRRLTESEWDIIEYHRCPDNLRHIQWGNRLPGFLPSSI